MQPSEEVFFDSLKEKIKQLQLQLKVTKEEWQNDIDENKPLKEALENISKRCFNTGRADLLGLEIKEFIRSTLKPNTPCPHCNGLGKVPTHRPRECDWCKFFHEYPMGGGHCDKRSGYLECSDSCSEFEFVLKFSTCVHCGGTPFKPNIDCSCRKQILEQVKALESEVK